MTLYYVMFAGFCLVLLAAAFRVLSLDDPPSPKPVTAAWEARFQREDQDIARAAQQLIVEPWEPKIAGFEEAVDWILAGGRWPRVPTTGDMLTAKPPLDRERLARLHGRPTKPPPRPADRGRPSTKYSYRSYNEAWDRGERDLRRAARRRNALQTLRELDHKSGAVAKYDMRLAREALDRDPAGYIKQRFAAAGFDVRVSLDHDPMSGATGAYVIWRDFGLVILDVQNNPDTSWVLRKIFDAITSLERKAAHAVPDPDAEAEW